MKMKRSESLRNILAYHEAGHAVLARKLGAEVVCVNVRARSGEVYRKGWVSRYSDPHTRIADYRRNTIIALAGQCAEYRFGNDNESVDATQDMINAKSSVLGIIILLNGCTREDEPGTVTIDEEWLQEIWEDFEVEFNQLRNEAARLVEQQGAPSSLLQNICNDVAASAAMNSTG
jgi:hypothetical protein